MVFMRRIAHPKCWKFTQKLNPVMKANSNKVYRLLLFTKRNFDCLVLLFTLYILSCYYIFHYGIVAPPTPDAPWWKCPIHKGWSILGKVPRYNESLVDTFDEYKTPFSVPQLAKYLPKPRKSSQKVILFDHIPMEDISTNIDPTLCGGNCTISFNRHKLHPTADAVVFSLKFPPKLPSRA